MPRLLTKDEREAIWVALGIRRNVIETGTYNLSSADVQNMGTESAKKTFNAEINALGTSQMQIIILTQKLVTAALQDRLMIIEE